MLQKNREHPSREGMVRSIARSSEVVGRMLDNLSDRYYMKPGKRLAALMLRLAPGPLARLTSTQRAHGPKAHRSQRTLQTADMVLRRKRPSPVALLYRRSHRIEHDAKR